VAAVVEAPFFPRTEGVLISVLARSSFLLYWAGVRISIRVKRRRRRRRRRRRPVPLKGGLYVGVVVVE